MRPDISADISNPNLVGSNEKSSWVHGHNCVYRDSSVAEYRVSIRTDDGWKSYGHFRDLNTATYVANIAILAEGCEKKYQLNRDIGHKDMDELARWRAQMKNSDLERTARERFSDVSRMLEVKRLEEERQTAAKIRLSTEKAQAAILTQNQENERVRRQQEQQAMSEAEQLREIPTATLLSALQGNITGSQARAIRAALEMRGFGQRAT